MRLGKSNWKDWLKCACIRAVKTMAQAAIAAISSAYLFQDVDWLKVGSVTLLAGILSLLTSLATGLPEVNLPTEE